MLKGIFLDGSVQGLDYTAHAANGAVAFGKTDQEGRYTYNPGDTLTFSIGGYILGSCKGKDSITPLDFVAESARREAAPSHYQVLNISRLLLGIGAITDEVRRAVEAYRYTLDPVMETELFEQETKALMERIGRSLKAVHETKNIVRRCKNGILKETDVKIPVRDGGWVLADVYRPVKEGKYPVVMCMGVFGKSFVNGFALNEEEKAFAQMAEDKFYEDYGNTDTKHMLQGIFFKRMGPCFGSALPVPNTDLAETADAPQGPPPCLVPVSEVFEQPCAMDWVPYGYVVINIEERGVGGNETEGLFKQFGADNARDYCDAIEWAAQAPFSNGSVGLFGASYYAMTQYLAAQRRPKGLKAMIPIMGDYDSYRDYIYSGGGLLNRADNMDPCTKKQSYNFMSRALEEPFWSEEIYGPEGEYMSSCDISKIDYPIWPVVEPDASLHGKGSSEAYINCASKNKKLLVVNGCGIHFWMYNPEYLNKFRAFFDFWLKGEQNGIMEEAAVALQMRTGEGSYYWRYEKDWPVPGTKYERFYLDASAKRLSEKAPEAEAALTYNADVCHSLKGRVEGATFISEPLSRDLEIAGYIKAGLYVSSSTSDMEIHMKVRVLDENDQEVIYPARTSMERTLPLGFGAMKASHRTLAERTRIDLPIYEHTKEAYKPLTPGEAVLCEVGTFPTTGVIKAGWKLRLDIDPVGTRWVDYHEADYRKGSENTIHTGGAMLSYLQLPVIGYGRKGDERA